MGAPGTTHAEDLAHFFFPSSFPPFTVNIQGSVSTLSLEMEFLSLDSRSQIKSLFIQSHE